MADETEVLDWDEDDTQTPFVAADDDEDAVSLGASDDELDAPDPAPEVEELPAPPPSATPEAAETTPSKRQSSPSRRGQPGSRARGDRDRDRDRERHRDSRDDRERDRERDGHGHRERERRPHKMTVAQPVTHALPPKPVTTVPAFMHPSHPSSIEATLMAPSSLKDAKDGKPKSTSTATEGKPKSSATPNGAGTPGAHHANLKSSSTDRDNYKSSGADRDPLPDDWEMRQSRNPNSNPNNPNSNSPYYYNTRTYKSTWERPRDAPGDEREHERRPNDDRAHPRADDRDRAHATRGQHHRDRDGQIQTSNSSSSGGHVDSAGANQNEDDELSYKDRHYRPEGPADLTSGTPAASIPGMGIILTITPTVLAPDIRKSHPPRRRAGAAGVDADAEMRADPETAVGARPSIILTTFVLLQRPCLHIQTHPANSTPSGHPNGNATESTATRATRLASRWAAHRTTEMTWSVTSGMYRAKDRIAQDVLSTMANLGDTNRARKTASDEKAASGTVNSATIASVMCPAGTTVRAGTPMPGRGSANVTLRRINTNGSTTLRTTQGSRTSLTAGTRNRGAAIRI
ncbi:hypothetical protein B0H19DRAFT_677434 [Mycena capillaripes]|nr:hypothetical protein B0H19DRAFT_677434 [Mycena capillaripes]